MTDVGIEVLHRLLSHVIHGPREQVGVGDDQVTAFLETLKKGLLRQLQTLISKFKFSFVVPICGWKKLLKYQPDSSCVIISLIPFTNLFYKAF